MKHPIQPIEIVDEIARFKKNEIVRFLLDAGQFDMNSLALMQFSDEDRMQFAQLIGYSVSGFGDLSYVDDDTFSATELMRKNGKSELDARLETLEETLNNARQLLKPVVSSLYHIAEEDLDTKPTW